MEKKVSKFDECNIIYSFSSNALQGAIYQIITEKGSDFDYLVSAYQKVYGPQKKADVSLLFGCLENAFPFFGLNEKDNEHLLLTLNMWELEDGTHVFVYSENFQITGGLAIAFYAAPALVTNTQDIIDSAIDVTGI